MSEDETTTETAATTETTGTKPAEPDTPPLESPAAKDGTRLLQWIGEPPRYLTRRTKDGKVDKQIDYTFESGREAPTPNHSVRSLRPASLPGLSRTYHWGPNYPFVAEVLAPDAELILSSSEGAKFRDVTDEKKFGTRTMKSVMEAGLIRRLDDSLHQPTVDRLKSRGRT